MDRRWIITEPQHELSGSGANPDLGAVTYPLPGGIVAERDVKVAMRDGVRLAVTVYRPEAEGRFPVILCVTAYGKDFGPADYVTLPRIRQAGMAVGTMHISEVTTWEGPDPGFWVPAGYVVVVANARGFYDSEGEPSLYSQQEANDYADLIDWAGVQPWSSGAVGLNGVSYLAITQWSVASRAKPAHLKAIVPWEGASDHLRDSLQHGGIPETRFSAAWFAGSLARGAGEEIVARGPSIMEEAMRSPFPLENVDVPALVCASWSDHGLHTRGSVEGFMRISSQQKWLYTHGGNKWEVYYSPEALDWQKGFFDHFLKGEDNGFEQRPSVRLEVRDTKDKFKVLAERTWPPADVKRVPMYLDLEQGKLVDAPPAQAQVRSYDAENKDTVELDLTFDRLTEVTGPMVLRLWVAAADADDLDLFVAVRKLDRDGREVHFCGKDGYREGVVALGWLRVSQRHQDPDRSTPYRAFLSHDRSEKIQPGEVVPVDIEILPSSTLFHLGETLRLVISGRDIMEHARFGHDDSVNKGAHILRAGRDFPSCLTIPLRSDTNEIAKGTGEFKHVMPSDRS